MEVVSEELQVLAASEEFGVRAVHKASTQTHTHTHTHTESPQNPDCKLDKCNTHTHRAKQGRPSQVTPIYTTHPLILGPALEEIHEEASAKERVWCAWVCPVR